MAALSRPAVSPRLTFLHRGFTLTEMAVVLVIVALLIGGMILPMSAQQDIRSTVETQKLLSEVSEALYGFAASHSASDGKPYLPCPDTDNDGTENRAASPGACASQEGRIPWSTLGLGQADAWNNRLRYRVTAVFSNSATGFQLTGSNGTLRICTDNACGTSLATGIPAVILSHGKNGAGAFNPAGGTNSAPTDADELENADTDDDFVSKVHAAAFDDSVAWISPNILFNRMIAAGRLP
ncbi:MAG: type II secretion system protein [Rhodocyclaceae bacterium]|jgi:prepilin-type N-terminal cleavage/methylation domain-containing protein|nr:type II secretion system protein [Rhodocyclaceae bacterium]